MVSITLPRPDQPPQPQPIWLGEIWVVYKWRKQEGFKWQGFPSSSTQRYTFQSTPEDGHSITHIIDPITAIGLGLVQPEELEFPPAALAYFNILRGNQ